MTLRSTIDRLLGGSGNEEDANVQIYCPTTDGDDREIIATEETEPVEWVQDDAVAVYDCPVCGRRHRFLWGPPAPLYLGDSTRDEDAREEEGVA